VAVPATPELPDPTGDDVIEQARRQVVAGHYLQAVAGLTAHLDAHPDDALAWRRLAGALIGAGFLPRAIAAADRAIELAPDEPIAYRNRSVANMTLKNFAAMRADAERALALASDDPEVLTLLAYGALLVDRDVSQARAYWERAYALDPQHAAVRRVGLILRSEPRYALLLAAAPGAYAGIVTLGFAAATLELPWLLAPVAVFAVILVAAILVRFRRVPPRPAGPGVLAAGVVGAAFVAGACTFVATGSLLPALALELVTAVLGALTSIRHVLVWLRFRRAARQPSPI